MMLNTNNLPRSYGDPSDPCAICQEDKTNTCMLPCGHEFCRGCVEYWSNKAEICPTCTRKFITDCDIRHLFEIIMENENPPVETTMDCPYCPKSIPVEDMRDHYHEEHAHVTCSECNEKVRKSSLDRHRRTTCRNRLVDCPAKKCRCDIPRWIAVRIEDNPHEKIEVDERVFEAPADYCLWDHNCQGVAVCEFCGHCFWNHNMLMAHCAVSHPDRAESFRTGKRKAMMRAQDRIHAQRILESDDEPVECALVRQRVVIDLTMDDD